MFNINLDECIALSLTGPNLNVYYFLLTEIQRDISTLSQNDPVADIAYLKEAEHHLYVE